MDKDELIHNYTWRGVTIPIYLDDNGQQFYTILDDKVIGFGAFNSDWEYDAKRLIDDKLDYICDIKEFPGAHLRWFDNGCDRDIVLYYRLRLIRIFLIDDELDFKPSDLKSIKSMSIDALKKYQGKYIK